MESSTPTSKARRARRDVVVVVCLMVAATFLGPGPSGLEGASAQEATGRLSLFKRIENLDTGSSEGRRELWTMHAENLATGDVIEGDGLNGVQSLEVPAGTYRIAESGGVDGYRFESWNCGGADIPDPTPEIVVPAGGAITCTVENVAISPTLTLAKEVVGGTASPTDWQLRAQGPESIAGVSGSADVTNQPVRIGQYTLSEEGGPDGYRSEGWSCEGADLSGDVVTLDLGRSATCTVRNVAPEPPDVSTLTLVKQVEGPTTAEPADWELTATGPDTTVSGPSGSDGVTSAPVPAGEYELSETGPTGFEAGPWQCEGGSVVGATVAVGAGADVTCTITNTYVEPTPEPTPTPTPTPTPEPTPTPTPTPSDPLPAPSDPAAPTPTPGPDVPGIDGGDGPAPGATADPGDLAATG